MLHLFAETTYDYSYGSTTTTTGPGAGFWIGYGIFLLVTYLVASIALSRVFGKAGRSKVAAFIPFYNNWVLLELGGKSGANIFWLFLPIAGPIVYLVKYIQAMLELARRFGKSQAFAIVGLFLFSIVGFLILAFDKSVYSVSPSNVGMGGGYPPQPIDPAQQYAQPAPTQIAPQQPVQIYPQNPSVPTQQPPQAPQQTQPPTQPIQPPQGPLVQ